MQKKIFGSGDNGMTEILGNKKISKTDPRIELLGFLDVLLSFIALAIVKNKNNTLKRIAKEIQDISSKIAAEKDLDDDKLIKQMEIEITKIESKLKPLKGFYMPKNKDEALVNIARTICRKAEINCHKLKKPHKNIAAYLNRLSTLLFAICRS